MTGAAEAILLAGVLMGKASGALPDRLTKAGKTNLPPVSIAIPAKVIRIIDGDTIVVVTKSGKMRVRLAGIDAPEVGQPGGLASKFVLATAIAGKPIVVIPRAKDKHDRVVADILSRKMVWLNPVIVCGGWAWASRIEVNFDILDCERVAKANRLGIWAQGLRQTPPWKWRKEGSR